MSDHLVAAIGRLRRAQPRNLDTMDVCDALEARLVTGRGELPASVLAAAPKVAAVECAECRRRRAQTAAQVRRFRSKKRSPEK